MISSSQRSNKLSAFTLSMIALVLCVIVLLARSFRFVSSGSIDEMMEYARGRASRSLRVPLVGVDAMRFTEISNNLKWLSKVGDEMSSSNIKCNSSQTRKVFIRGKQYGGFSNNIIALAHGLGFVEALNAYHHGIGEDIRYSLVIPNYMVSVLNSFDLRALRKNYCFVANEVPSEDELADQEEVLTLSTVLSLKKSISVKINKLNLVIWNLFDYPSRSIRADMTRMDIYGLRGQSLSETKLQSRKFYSSSPHWVDEDIELDSKMLFFWGYRQSLESRMRLFPYLYLEEEILALEKKHYTKTYVAILCTLWGSLMPSVIHGAVLSLRGTSEVDLLNPEKRPRRPKHPKDKKPKNDKGEKPLKSQGQQKLTKAELVNVVKRGQMQPGEHVQESVMRYSAAHQRDLNGDCEEIMKFNSEWSRDFQDLEVSKTDGHSDAKCESEWCRRSLRQSILCDMPLDFLKHMSERESPHTRHLYIASSAKLPKAFEKAAKNHEWGEIKAHSGWSVTRNMGLSEGLSTHEISCMDILLCTMATGVFIGNPRSTFSFQIATLRSVLGLKSFPKTPNHDIYFIKPFGDEKMPWISRSSVSDVNEAHREL